MPDGRVADPESWRRISLVAFCREGRTIGDSRLPVILTIYGRREHCSPVSLHPFETRRVPEHLTLSNLDTASHARITPCSNRGVITIAQPHRSSVIWQIRCRRSPGAVNMHAGGCACMFCGSVANTGVQESGISAGEPNGVIPIGPGELNPACAPLAIRSSVPPRSPVASPPRLSSPRCPTTGASP